jgi:hypothetical protein
MPRNNGEVEEQNDANITEEKMLIDSNPSKTKQSS